MVAEAILDLNFSNEMLILGLQPSKISPAARVTDATDVTDVCFCFLWRGARPSEGAGGVLIRLI